MPKAVETEITDFEAPIRNRCLDTFLRSKFNKTIANWKAESPRNSISKELAPEDASIARHGDFESDRFAVGRLRRRHDRRKISQFRSINIKAFGETYQNPIFPFDSMNN